MLPSSRRSAGWLSRAVITGLIVGIIAAVALADISLRPLNLASLYMIPMILGAQHYRRSSSVLWLAIVLILLNYVGLGAAYSFHAQHLARFRIINRGFIAMALAISALLAVFYIRIRDYWQARQALLAPNDEEASLLLQAFQMFEDITSCILAAVFAGITFWIDIQLPEEYNLAILYLVPLAVLALTRNRWLLWSATPILLALAYFGFIMGPRGSTPDIDEWVVQANRAVAAAAIVLAAILFHITGRPASKNPAATPAPLESAKAGPTPP